MRGAILSVFLGLSLPTVAWCAASADSTSVRADVATPWTFYGTAFGYILFDDDDFVTVVGMADRGRLHIEARYNYEDLRTASAWIGANFEGGASVSYELTVMGGVVFGATDGVAPGFRGTLFWRDFDFSSEGEYLFDAHDGDDNFFYSWSELAWSSGEVIRTGVAVQRTKVYQTDSSVQLGLFAGTTRGNVNAAIYVFEPGSDAAALLLLAGVAF